MKQFKPRLDQFVGNKEEIAKMRINLVKHIPTILVGPPGVGKTSGVYATCEELGLDIIEVNASDVRSGEKLNEYLRSCQMGHFTPTVYLFDEIDGMEKSGAKKIVKMLSISKFPIILTANDLYKVPDEIQKRCEIIKYKQPLLSQVVERIKQIAEDEKIQPNFSRVHGDVRNSILATIYGSEGYGTTNSFQRVTDILEKGIVEGELDFTMKVWLVDNIPRYYTGGKMYEAYQILAKADLYSPEILRLMPKGRGKPIQPVFFKRMKARRTEGDKES
jgi:replication-associated recombination protein RarA